MTPSTDVIAVNDDLSFVIDNQFTFFSSYDYKKNEFINKQDELVKENQVEQLAIFEEVEARVNKNEINDRDFSLRQEILNEFELSSEKENTDKLKSKFKTYEITEGLGAPERFKKAVVSSDTSGILMDIVVRFRFDELITVTQESATKILMEQVEIFEGKAELPKEISATLAQREIDNLAQRSLFDSDKYGIINVRSLHEELEKRLYNGWGHMLNVTSVREGLHKILALKPKALKSAVQEALAQNIEIVEADIIPKHITSNVELDPSRFNL